MICLTSPLSRFRRSEDGAALVEFGLLLPVFLLMFALAVEGSRTFWAYQTAIAGVRDASRFVARSAPNSLCETAGTLNSYTSKVTDIVTNTVGGDSLFPASITIASVTPTLTCITGNYAMGTVPVANITAVLNVSYPFSGVFDLIGVDLGDVSTTVTDQSRIYGV
ncbi:TadE/TadG family type IV pilus assembly protein [uncultured Litoreibacter sp.]|uniref:TadE/TadG family type IV pilus assembly protein n=1 Tax=uncultured Litoreibacter sp. TaxID=1392394 RepID=UPI002602513D|nr:TadE/TadG family type IV pilus assembly protein [uncultured Litoreibacter sp.]